MSDLSHSHGTGGPSAAVEANGVAHVVLRHNKVTLALHRLRDGTGRPLLHLHGLGERTPERVPAALESWRGPVWGLDFTGHGASTIPKGGGYTVELLMGDADAALAHLGEATIFGRGIGAYVALLIAGARPDLVKGAVLFDGPGIAGGGPSPGTANIVRVDPDAVVPPDPFALAELSQDVRPADYAATFARMTVQSSKVDPPLVVAAFSRPPWLDAVVDEFGVTTMSLGAALRRYSTA
ncbi:MAG: alpha/beta hydrolase [Actinomycetota bacterium]|nr:alpha/beta hydrolase [Actinomycetota bacterium]